MGAAFSRSKPESADQSAREQDALEEQQDGRAVEATEVPTQGQRQEQQEQQQEERHHVQQTAASVPATATDTTRQRTDVFIPADIAMILDSGLHRDPDNDEDFATAKAAAPGQSIQDAVREFKEKYRINMGMGDGSAAGAPAGDEREEGELEDVRAELEKREGSLKARLAALKQRQQQQRQQQAGSTHTANATVTHVKTTESSGESSDGETSSSSESDGDGEQSDAAAESSGSSSGSSLHLSKPRQNKKRKAAKQGPTPADDDDDDDEPGSDEDGFGGGRVKGGPKARAAAAAAFFASKHEILNPSVPVAPVDRFPDAASIRPFGYIDSVIENVIVMRADIRAEESIQGQVLDEGSIVCLEDKRVIGPIFETFGAVHAPLYSIRLPADHALLPSRHAAQATTSPPASNPSTPAEPALALVLRQGTPVFYCPDPAFSALVFTQQIRRAQTKGSDASNIHDEEPAHNEVEFSDDEQEQEYRRMLKQRKKMRTHERQNGITEADDQHEFQFDSDYEEDRSVDGPQEAGLEDDVSVWQDLQADSATQAAAHLAIASTTTSDHQSVRAGETSSSGRGKRGVVRGQGKHARGSERGGREGRGRGRGQASADRGASTRGGPGGRGRGNVRGALSARGRGRGRDRDGMQDAHSSPQAYHDRPGPHGVASLPSRPTFQHPDALPYDNPATLPAAPRMPEQSFPQGTPAPLSGSGSGGVEGYNPHRPIHSPHYSAPSPAFSPAQPHNQRAVYPESEDLNGSNYDPVRWQSLQYSNIPHQGWTQPAHPGFWSPTGHAAPYSHVQTEYSPQNLQGVQPGIPLHQAHADYDPRTGRYQMDRQAARSDDVSQYRVSHAS